MAAFARALSRSNFTSGYQQQLLNLFQSCFEAVSLTRQATTNFSLNDLNFFDANPGYFLVPDGETMPSLTGNVDSQFQFIQRARRLR
jgi:hypothetical protein